MTKTPLESWSIERTNQTLNLDFEASYWEFLIKQINYPDITFANNTISFPPFIPLAEVVQEVLTEIEQGDVALESCQVCQQYYNLNKEEGIFGDPQHLKNFICQSCATKLSARDFYENYLKT